jgi:hypothetical protein
MPAMPHLIAFAMISLAMLSGTAIAYAQEPQDASNEPQYAVEGQSLRITRVGSSTVVDLGCEGRSLLRAGTKLLVSCGKAGVVEFDLTDPLSPRRDGTMRVDGDAGGLFLHDGEVWVDVSHVDARPVRIGTESIASEGSRVDAPASSHRSRRYISPVRQTNSAPDDVPQTSSVKPDSDSAEESPSIVAPPRKGNLWEMSLLMGAFVTMGSLGAGTLGSASVSYTFEPPIVVRAEVAPFGVAGPSQPTTNANPVPFGQTANTNTTTGGRAVTSFAAHFIVGLDTQFVEVGLGVGGASVNQSSPVGPPGGGQPATGAVSVAEEGRIGARDGLAVIVESSAVAVNGKFELGYFVGSFQIPLSTRIMVIARGGGGNVGFAYGDLGLRAVVRGDGGHGTLALTGFIGGAAITENLCSSNPDSTSFTVACATANLVGPSLGGGVQWRL